MPVDLQEVDRIIARTEGKVAEQTARIARLRDQSRDTRHAEQVLGMLEDGLTAFRSTRVALATSFRMVEESEATSCPIVLALR